MKVSLIIPVYNVENYLEKCLNSVKAQSFSDFEVILVNDGSTDSSLSILERFAAENENFRLYTIENSGQGGARNFGLTKATGEYIAFLDSDDYIAKDCLERLVEAAEKENGDIVVCTSYDVKEDGTILAKAENNLADQTTSVFESPWLLFNRVAPWGKLFKKSLFGDLRFETRVWYEDMRLIPKLYLNAEKITFIQDPLFYYVQRAGSTMNNANAKRNLEIISAFEDLISYFKKAELYTRFQEELEYLVIEHLAVAAVTRVVLSRAPERKEVLKALRQYLAGFEGLYQNKYRAHLGKNKSLILFFNRARLYFLTEICMKLKNKIKG